jgi:hypothetical protein
MTGIFAKISIAGKPRCARCKRPFTPRKNGDRYGSKCARIAAKDHIEVRNTKGEVVAVIV